MSGFALFSKTIILPAVTALFLYLIIFHALLPLYVRHRDRYRQYLPLNSASNFASRLPSVIHPTTIRARFTNLFAALTNRIFFPSTYAAQRRESTSSDASLFDAESGEAMVGFDVQERESESQRQIQRQRQDRLNADMENARRTVSGQTVRAPLRFPGGYDQPDPTSDRRLSRELEEGFRDDSESEGEEGDVTVGRRSMSARR